MWIQIPITNLPIVEGLQPANKQAVWGMMFFLCFQTKSGAISNSRKFSKLQLEQSCFYWLHSIKLQYKTVFGQNTLNLAKRFYYWTQRHRAMALSVVEKKYRQVKERKKGKIIGKTWFGKRRLPLKNFFSFNV